jgi:hypothetical protein
VLLIEKSVTFSHEFPKTADPSSLGIILSFACKTDGHNAAMIAPEDSPSWKGSCLSRGRLTAGEAA